MVELTPEQMRKAEFGDDPYRDVLPEVDRRVAGKSAKRLLLAMDDPAAIAERARLMSGAALRVEAICQRHIDEPRTAILLVREELKWLQWKWDALGTGPSRLMRIVK